MHFLLFPFIFSYNTIKTWIQKGNKTTPLGPIMHMVAAAEAGILTLVITNPIWVVKTRLCLQYGPVAELPQKQYNGMVDALAKIYRVEGIRGLYRVGFFFLLFVVPFSCVSSMYLQVKQAAHAVCCLFSYRFG